MTTATPLTSAVALATYNGSRYLETQLRTLLSQTRHPDQVVVSDDGSNDSTMAIVHRYRRLFHAEVIVLEARERVGPVGNFERALRAVDADIAFLCDQDDVWEPHKIDVMMTFLERNGDIGGAFTDANVLADDTILLQKPLWAFAGFKSKDQERWRTDPLGVLLRKNVVTGAALAFRTSRLTHLLPLPTGGWHDLSIAVLLSATSRLEPMPERLLRYRLHGTNAAGLPTGSRLSRVVSCEEHRANLRDQIEHWMRLRERLVELRVQQEAVARVDGKIAHLLVRARLPLPRPRRIIPAVGEALQGGYRRYANAEWSLLRDIIGP